MARKKTEAPKNETTYEGVAPNVSPTPPELLSEDEAKEATGKNLVENDESTLKINEAENDEEHSEEDKKKLEEDLSSDNLVARVVTWTGSYLKVKFLRDGKLFTTYKGKNGDVESAKKARDEALKNEETSQS